MTFRLSSFGFLPALILGISLLFASHGLAGEKQRGRSIEFSDRKSDEVTTNLNQMGSKKDGLRQLEDDLGKPFQTFNPKSSLDGIFTPPTRQPNSSPTIPSKRAKELMERQKNWIFMTPEDLAGAPTEEDIFKMHEYDKDGQEKKKSSPLERFMEKQQAERKGTLKKSGSKEDDLEMSLTGKDRKLEHDDSALPEGLRESEQALKKLFESDATSRSLSPIAPANSSVDIFGLGSPSPSLTPAENPNIAIYRTFLNSHAPPTPSDSLSSIPGLADSFTPRHDSFPPSPALGSIGFPTAPGLPDMKSFSQVPPPRVDPPRMGPPTPTFSVQQRKFQ